MKRTLLARPPGLRWALLGLAPLLALGACAASRAGQEAADPSGPGPAAAGQASPAPSPVGMASAKPAAWPSPWPPLAEQPPLSCPEDGFSTRSIPAEALGPAGLPLPASLCIGARLDALPLLRGQPHQGQPADEGLVQGSGPARLYQVAGARVLLRLQGSDPPRVAGAMVTAAGPEGLSAEAARAWLQALAPCAAVPDFRASTAWYQELTAAKTPGFEADQIRMLATTSDTPDWQAEQRRLLGFAAAASSFAPQAPPGRWLGVVAMAYHLRQ